MRTGLTVSTGLHTVLLAVTLIAWPFADQTLPEPPSFIPVDLLTVAEETNIRAQTRTEESKPEPEPAQEEEPVQVASAPPEPPPAPEPELAPAPLAPEPAPPPEPAPAPEVKQEAPPPVPDVKPRPKPPAPVVRREKPREKEFNLDEILGVIDRAEQKPRDEGETQTASAEQTTRRAGLGTQLTLSEKDALLAQISRCWNVPVGSPNPGELIVKIFLRLQPSGALSGAPEYVEQTRFLTGDTYYRAAAEAARRAVIQCAPYQLPPGKYDVWKEIEVTMDPRRMAGR